MATEAPPATVETYEFSYSRTKQKMRWRLKGNEWLSDREAGKGKVVGFLPKTGHLLIQGRLVIQDGTAFVYPS